MEDSTESFEDSQEQRVYSALVAIVDGKVKEETPNAEPTQSKDMDGKDETETNSDKDAPAQEDSADMDVEADMDGIEPPAKDSSFLHSHAKAQFVSAVLAY